MGVSERLLLGPGPSNPSPEVMAALARPLLGHFDPEFLHLLDETMARLRLVFRTDNVLTFPISGTGSAGMETCLGNWVGPGSVVVVGVNGLFGERMCELVRRLDAELVRVEAPWGEPLDPAQILSAHPSPDLIALVHAETSTGVRNDIAAVAAGKGDALVLADVVTSLAGIELEIDAWGIDIAYSGTQKCLSVPPGLAPITVSPQAVDRMRPSRSWYLDLSLLKEYVTAGGARAYHHTAPISMVYALHAGLGVVLDEGLEVAWARHRAVGQDLHRGLEKLGLECFADERCRLPELTTAIVPEHLPSGLDEAQIRSLLLDRYRIEIGGGVGPLAGRVWRIGLMGYNAQHYNVARLLGALAEVLGR